MDRLKQREALFTCFLCLDIDNKKKIDKSQFYEFMN